MSEGKIVLSEDDYSILKRLVDRMVRSGKLGQPHFKRLAEEMKHAIVMSRDELPPKLITMGSRIRFTCIETRQTAEVVLVFPAQAHDESCISILTPLGLALIGEREGTEVEYVAPGGTFRIQIDKVEQTAITQEAVQA